MREQLQRHYDAINARDYEGWRGTVVQQRADGLPEPEWQQAYASTRDGTIRIDRIDRIDAAPDAGLLVRVRFVSTQDVADAPPDLQVPAHLLALDAPDARAAAPDRHDRGRQLRTRGLLA